MADTNCAINGCERPVKSRGWCRLHYRRWKKHGNPLEGAPSAPAQAWVRNHLTNHPDTDECIEWPYSVNTHGYPQVRWQGRFDLVSRITLRHFEGVAPQGALATHKPLVCHNPACVNARHLRWATPKQNTADRELDGTVFRGSKHPNTYITEDTAVAIYNATGPRKEIAKRYGTTIFVVQNIRYGRTWSHVTGHSQITNTTSTGPK